MSKVLENQENMAFETEVRRVAEAVWGLEPGACKPEFYSSNRVITELDGIAKLPREMHLIMVTTSRKLDKCKSDVKKLLAAANHEKRHGLFINLWLITKDALNAEHIRYAADRGVQVLTFNQFRDKFFNGADYIQKRRVGSFGSARNLRDGTITLAEDEYVSLPMQLTEYINPNKADGPSKSVAIADIVGLLNAGRVIVMVGPFGAGKSLTTREVFFKLIKEYFKDRLPIVPIALNLREHWGLEYADEILTRHARNIGFTPKENLTIAWRAGFVALLVDGFDEVASQGVATVTDVKFMRETRYRALQGVRDLLSQAPSGVGILVCGRNNYFDSLAEVVHALGISGRRFGLIELDEFTESQAEEFLKRHGISTPLPDWLPRKPLMLGYLANRNLLTEIVNINPYQGFGYVWDEFLSVICEREAAHERAAMEAATLRRVLERLAIYVRSTYSGTGPLTERELAEAYRLETGQSPQEGVLMQLQRLPGLTERGQDPGTRSFVDEELLYALQGSAIAGLVLGQTKDLERRIWGNHRQAQRQSLEGDGRMVPSALNHLHSKSVAMAAYLLVRKTGADHNTVLATLHTLEKGQLAADVVGIAIEMAREEGAIDCHGVVLEYIDFGGLDLDDMVVKGLVFRGCILEEVVVGQGTQESSVRIEDDCIIKKVYGVASSGGLPKHIFGRACEIMEFDELPTNNAVLASSNLEPPMKALITVLNKLYRQAGSGRRLGALKRGIPQGPVLDAVDEIIDILLAEQVVTISGSNIVHPIRRQTSRILGILNAPVLSEDPIVQRVQRNFS